MGTQVGHPGGASRPQPTVASSTCQAGVSRGPAHCGRGSALRSNQAPAPRRLLPSRAPRRGAGGAGRRELRAGGGRRRAVRLPGGRREAGAGGWAPQRSPRSSAPRAGARARSPAGAPLSAGPAPAPRAHRHHCPDGAAGRPGAPQAPRGPEDAAGGRGGRGDAAGAGGAHPRAGELGRPGRPLRDAGHLPHGVRPLPRARPRRRPGRAERRAPALHAGAGPPGQAGPRGQAGPPRAPRRPRAAGPRGAARGEGRAGQDGPPGAARRGGQRRHQRGHLHHRAARGLLRRPQEPARGLRGAQVRRRGHQPGQQLRRGQRQVHLQHPRHLLLHLPRPHARRRRHQHVGRPLQERPGAGQRHSPGRRPELRLRQQQRDPAPGRGRRGLHQAGRRQSARR